MTNLHEFQQLYHNIVLVNFFHTDICSIFSCLVSDSDMPDHMIDDLNQIPNPNSISIVAPPFSHISYHNPHSSSNIKKDDDHLFLHPSCIGDNHRRIPDIYTSTSSNNGNYFQQQISNVCIIKLIIFKTNTKEFSSRKVIQICQMIIHQKVKHQVFMVYYSMKMNNKHLKYENSRSL